MTELIPDTGVCLTEGQYLMSCVASIAADAIKPMMPGAVQPINVQIFDETGDKTVAPYGLKIEYSNPGLFELSSTMTTVNSNLNNVEGTGTFKITDPATDTTISRSVTVTNGKLEQAAYTVPPNGTVDVKLVDPASGIEVYRGAAFDIYVADGSFGSFTPITPGLGALTFHANGVATPAAQPIRLNGARDSGSTIKVELNVGIKVTPGELFSTESWRFESTGVAQGGPYDCVWYVDGYTGPSLFYPNCQYSPYSASFGGGYNRPINIGLKVYRTSTQILVGSAEVTAPAYDGPNFNVTSFTCSRYVGIYPTYSPSPVMIQRLIFEGRGNFRVGTTLGGGLTKLDSCGAWTANRNSSGQIETCTRAPDQPAELVASGSYEYPLSTAWYYNYLLYYTYPPQSGGC